MFLKQIYCKNNFGRFSLGKKVLRTERVGRDCQKKGWRKSPLSLSKITEGAFMSSELLDSELILNPNGSVYHLNLLPADIADTIILVGDPNRVSLVSKYFDHIEVKKTKREFITHTGTIGKKRLTVLGTGIGAGNIDIAINELDALVNIDLGNRKIKQNHKTLHFIRLGTSGSLQDSIPTDSLLISSYGIGLDGLMNYYQFHQSVEEKKLLQVCRDWFSNLPMVNVLYTAEGSKTLIELFYKNHLGQMGITLTSPGFYGAQNRQLRGKLAHQNLFSIAREIQFENQMICNLEMETAAIYGLARLLGHHACSISAIVANRFNHTFCKDPEKLVDQMIRKVLDILV